ncbi:MAG: replicative DNA helicase [Deltaproteobacteria bacterium]|nr:replicative DNA helicase [Deltaproteobacteria bacterium]
MENTARKNQFRSANISKIPPQALEAEQAILASVLIDNNALNNCMEYITPEDFYKEAHAIIFRAMLELSNKNEPTDLVTLNGLLQSKGQLDQVGGSAYLSHLVDSIPTASNVASYAKLVKDKSTVRKLISVGTEIVTDCYEAQSDVGDLVDSAENKIFQISEQKRSEGFAPVKDLVKASYKMIEELFENKSKITGLVTGFSEMDEMTAGLQKSDLIIVAGRPSMGKTAFSLNIVENAALKANAKVAVFSLEMSKESLVMRMLTSIARIDSMKVRTGDLDESDWPRLLAAAEKLAHMNVFIDDQPAQSTMEIRAKTRRLAKEQGGLDLILVDYLQLMRGATKTNSREQEISEISRSLKGIAKELNVPVIALSQLNRSLENRTNKRPMMSDLRESGAIEQDADVIMFIYRDEVYDPETPDKGIAEIIIGKQRNGSTGYCRLAFLNRYVRFEDLVYEGDYHYDDSNDHQEPASIEPGQESEIDPEDVIF